MNRLCELQNQIKARVLVSPLKAADLCRTPEASKRNIQNNARN